MGRIRLSTLWLVGTLGLMLVLLVALQGALHVAHVDESIHFVASDAATYFALYENVYEQLDFAESMGLYLIGSPILFMKLADGNLFLIQATNLAVMGLSLWIARDCFATLRGRIVFMAGALAFPYFLFGFLSLNKEVYAMSSAILYGSYLVRGHWSHLLAALLLAACARYYMVLALIVVLFLVPRTGQTRYGWAFALLVAISLAAPLSKSSVAGYSDEGVLDVSGASGLIFSRIVDAYGYFLVYPIKYLALIPMKAYAFLLDTGRAGDAMEAVVSLASLIVFVLAVRLLWSKAKASAVVRRLIVSGLLAPIPIMWTEILSWRYYSFVYFFFLYAIVLHHEARRPAGAPRLANA